jgi:uncharacterized protein with PIN domain
VDLEDSGLTLVVPASLQLFLHRRHRADPITGAVALRWDEEASLGHLVQSVGLPLTEVEMLLVDGVAHEPQGRVPRRGVVEPVPRRRPQPAPTDPPRFLFDVHLGALARLLRLLGVDAAYPTEAADTDDDRLLARSTAEQRVLLTRDQGLLRRRDARWAAYVRGQRPREQLTDVLDRFAPPLRPWSRCPVCNGRLVGVDVAEVADQLRPGTLRTYHDFSRCTSCGRAFWRGAHAKRLEPLVASVMRGRSATLGR